MKLFLLTRPWQKVDWDENQGLVVRARDEEEARAIAALHPGGEESGPWLNSQESDCEEITLEGPSEVILTDFNAG